jgi:hypothetical protein
MYLRKRERERERVWFPSLQACFSSVFDEVKKNEKVKKKQKQTKKWWSALVERIISCVTTAPELISRLFVSQHGNNLSCVLGGAPLKLQFTPWNVQLVVDSVWKKVRLRYILVTNSITQSAYFRSAF